MSSSKVRTRCFSLSSRQHAKNVSNKINVFFTEMLYLYITNGRIVNIFPSAYERFYDEILLSYWSELLRYKTKG